MHQLSPRSRYPALPYSSKFNAQMDRFNFAKTKRKKCVDVDVAADLLRYCEITRVRDPVLLDACAETFITNYSTVSNYHI